MAETLENQVLHTLGQVLDEQSEQNIVSLGMVKDIAIEEGRVSLILEFQENDQKKNNRIFENSKKAIEEIPGVTKVDVITTYHHQHNLLAYPIVILVCQYCSNNHIDDDHPTAFPSSHSL